MIKIFRKIRKKLIAENKFSRYLLYAIGEILLVVIGILIALQIGKWNEVRLDERKENFLLAELHNEFVQNGKELERTYIIHKNSLEKTEYVISQFPINPEEINLDTLQAKRQGWGIIATFNPSQGVVKSLIQTSSFSIISNQELRKLIVSWEDILEDYQEEELRALKHLEDVQTTILIKNIPYGDLTDKRLDKSYIATTEFEYAYKLRKTDLQRVINKYSIIQKRILKIIELSNPENQ